MVKWCPNETYRLFRFLIEQEDEPAFRLAFKVGQYTIKVRSVREHLQQASAAWIWSAGQILIGLDAEDDLGRFRAFHAPINHMEESLDEWIKRSAEIARAKSWKDAVGTALWVEKHLGGAGNWQLGQILHLLHPCWFAIVNGESEEFWRQRGFPTGGVEALETISSKFRKRLLERSSDFHHLDVARDLLPKITQ